MGKASWGVTMVLVLGTDAVDGMEVEVRWAGHAFVYH